MKLFTKTSVTCVLAIALSASSAVSASECIRPNSPIIPDGNVASKDELLSARDSFKEFESNVFDYRDCLKLEETNLPTESETVEAQKKAILALDDASVDYLKQVAEELNLAVRAFNQR